MDSAFHFLGADSVFFYVLCHGHFLSAFRKMCVIFFWLSYVHALCIIIIVILFLSCLLWVSVSVLK